MPTSGMLANVVDLGLAVLKPFSCPVLFTLCAELPPLFPLPARRSSYSINNFKSFVGFYVAGDTWNNNKGFLREFVPTSGVLATAADVGLMVLKPFSRPVLLTFCAELPPRLQDYFLYLHKEVPTALTS